VELPRNPFLLPLCQCGGTTRLSHVEPHATDEGKSLRTYVCQTCGSLQTHVVVRRNVPAIPPLRAAL